MWRNKFTSIPFLKLMTFILFFVWIFPSSLLSEPPPEEINRLTTDQLVVDIKQAFHSHEVVIVGWSHLAENWIIPSSIRDALPDIASDNLVIITEELSDEAISKEKSYTRGTEALEMISLAEKLNIPVIPGDIPSDQDKRLYKTADKFDPIGDEKSMHDRRKIRDIHFTQIISNQVLKEGRKVLLLIGDTHVPDLVWKLAGKGIKAKGIRTNVNFLTGEVLYEGKVLGYIRKTDNTDFLKILAWYAEREKRIEKIKLSAAKHGANLARVWIAEEIKEFWFSLTELSPERFVEFNKKLIESPESFLAYFASYEGFVAAETLSQRALGFKNGQTLDIRFLEKFPRIHGFAKAIKQEVPLAVAMVIMESLRRIIERKEVLAELEAADAMEKELFEIHVNNSILHSLALYGDASCDVLSDPETYQVGLRRAGQFILAGRMVKWGRRAMQAGRLFCAGAKARMAVEAATGPETGGASWIAFTGELAATFIIESYLDSAVTSFIEWWKERGFRVRLDEARARIYEIKNDPHATEEDFLKALDDVAIALEDYEYYLQLELQKTILAGQLGAKDMEEYYNKEIELIRSHAPHRDYGTYVAEAMGRSGTFSGELEERYRKTKEGWQILRTPVFEGKPSTGSNGYWGSVSTPTQKVDITDEEFEAYILKKIEEKVRFRNETVAQILQRTNENALLTAAFILGIKTDDEAPDRTSIRQLREEQIEFLKALQ